MICCALLAAFGLACGDEFPNTPCPDGTEQDKDTELCIDTVTVVEYRDSEPVIVEVRVEVPVDEPFPCPGQLADEQGNCHDESVVAVPPVLEVAFDPQFIGFQDVYPGTPYVAIGSFVFRIIGDDPVKVTRFAIPFLGADDPNGTYTVGGDFPVEMYYRIAGCLLSEEGRGPMGWLLRSLPEDRLQFTEFWIENEARVQVKCYISDFPIMSETPDGLAIDIDSESVQAVDVDGNPIEVRITDTNGNPPRTGVIVQNPPDSCPDANLEEIVSVSLAPNSPSGAGVPGSDSALRFIVDATQAVRVRNFVFEIQVTDADDDMAFMNGVAPYAFGLTEMMQNTYPFGHVWDTETLGNGRYRVHLLSQGESVYEIAADGTRVFSFMPSTAGADPGDSIQVMLTDMSWDLVDGLQDIPVECVEGVPVIGHEIDY